MQFGFTDEQRMMQEMAKDFAVKEIQPTLKDDEANHRFRPEIVKKMAELGFFGCALPEEYGGYGDPFMDLVIIMEEMGKAVYPSPFFSTLIQCGLTILAGGFSYS